MLRRPARTNANASCSTARSVSRTATVLAGITERQESPRSVQPVGVASVAVGNRDVQERAVTRLDTKRAAPAVHRRDAVDVEAVLREAAGEDRRVGKPAGAPNTR